MAYNLLVHTANVKRPFLRKMERRYNHLFCITFMLNFFILFLSFTGVISAPVTKPSIIQVMKNDTNLCEASSFLYDLEYTKLCASLACPTTRWEYNPQTLNNFLCVGIYDTAYKICQYFNILHMKEIVEKIDSYEVKYVPDKMEAEEKKFCDKLQGFASLYNKTDLLWAPLVNDLNIPHKCEKICFDFNDKFYPLCKIFAWIKDIDEMENIREAYWPNTLGTKHYPVASDKPSISQSNDKTTVGINSEIKKKSEAKETKEQSTKQITTDFKNDNNAKEDMLSMPGNAPNADIKSDLEKMKSDTEKPSGDKIHYKKVDDILTKLPKNNKTKEIQTDKSVLLASKENKEDTILNQDKPRTKPTEITESAKNIIVNNGPQTSSINIATGNVPNKDVNEGKPDEFIKEQDNDNLKTTTLSENTQDHYDAGNQEEDMDTNIGDNVNDDVVDTIQQPIDTENRNENVQDAFEQKNSVQRFPNSKTEDDSHFFTYVTVFTVACIIGYIGYHNKQKILAIVLEGRRGRNNRGRRRPSTASYRKLDCTLEEAVTSQCNANVTHVIY